MTCADSMRWQSRGRGTTACGSPVRCGVIGRGQGTRAARLTLKMSRCLEATVTQCQIPGGRGCHRPGAPSPRSFVQIFHPIKMPAPRASCVQPTDGQLSLLTALGHAVILVEFPVFLVALRGQRKQERPLIPQTRHSARTSTH